MCFGGCFHGVSKCDYSVVDSVLVCGVSVWCVVDCHVGFDLLIITCGLFFRGFFGAFPSVGPIFLQISVFGKFDF